MFTVGENSPCLCSAQNIIAVLHAHVQVETEMMAHIAAAEKKSNILERQLNQVSTD